MTGKLGAGLRAAAVLSIATWWAACGGGGEPASKTAPPTVLIAVSESSVSPAIGETEASGVFAVVRYVLANGSDEDVVVSQGDLRLVMPDGAAVDRSEPGTDAWGEAPGGYELTETVLLKPGGMPRPWVSVFDVPDHHDAGPWNLRYKDEPPVEVPAPSQ